MPITLNGDTGITTPTYGGANTAEYLVPVTQFKNRIINGAMVIDQRNAGASVSISGVGTLFTLDRYAVRLDTSTGSTCIQSTVAPDGFVNSMLLTIGTGASPSAAQINFMEQRIEGFNIADLGWGTANAKAVTVSFWVRSSLTGTFGCSLRNSAVNRCYVTSYSISSANTWEYKTVTIPGDTTGTWLTNNGVGIYLSFDIGEGSNRNASSTNTWLSANTPGLSGGVKLCATTGATWRITGVQLEVGESATGFDYRPYGTELALCQRYYYKLFPEATAISFGIGFATGTTAASCQVSLPVEMRTAPTSLEQQGTANRYAISDVTTATVCSAVPVIATGLTTTRTGGVGFTVASGLTQFRPYRLITDSTNGATAFLAWSAEL